MVDENFSQIPVTNESRTIIGVFSWASFGKRVADLGSSKIEVTTLPVKEALEEAKFIGPNVYIDTATNWDDIEYVLVGTPDNLLGILNISDVFGRLNDFAEAFVLIHEIEHEIRDSIKEVCSESQLTEMISRIKRPPNSPPPRSLEDFSFSQYQNLICNKDNWETFEPFFASVRELVYEDFKEITSLRNDVFHFRRTIRPKDSDRLRRFLNRLKYNREMYKNKCSN